MKCPNCPVDGDYCRGLEVRRFCELLDPSNPAHRPTYRGVVLYHTALHSGQEPPQSDPTRPATLASGPCCGGFDPMAIDP